MDKILLFIPMYNCEKQITRVLGQLTPEVLKYIAEVVVINNRSTDGGEEAAIAYCRNHPELPVRILRNDENYGLGGSHKVAFNEAVEGNYDAVITLHGDDQGRIADFIPLLESGEYRSYDCCLGARFMKGSKLIGYSPLRILGNYGFNWLFSLAVGRSVKDLGSGLNLYRVETLKSRYFMKYPDTLYFNDLMILASCYYQHKILFYPISWREEDQVSNNKLWKFSMSLLKMLKGYRQDPKAYLEQDLRTREIMDYSAQTVYSYKEL
ncbi:MAG: glycosyltransferase family 2 protein [Lachnospiraceae bacterium]|nr:glycosyltransferase family 2 protein [Lachnospiraceae bacterium]